MAKRSTPWTCPPVDTTIVITGSRAPVQDAAVEVGGHPIELARPAPAEMELDEGVLDDLLREPDVAQHQRCKTHERRMVLTVQKRDGVGGGVAAHATVDGRREGIDLDDLRLQIGRGSCSPATSQELRRPTPPGGTLITVIPYRCSSIIAG